MEILIQKHREHPVWKFYDEKRAYLGQILGDKKETMPALAKEVSEILLGKENPKYKKEQLADKSLNLYDVKTKKRVAGIEKDFEAIAKIIQDNLK